MRHLMLDIARLHEAFGHPVRRVPLIPNEVNDEGAKELQQRLLLRLRLVAEEFFELVEGALGLGGSYRNWYTEATMAVELTLKEWQPDYDYNAIETADALTDLVVVIVGMALELGIPIDRTWNEVQRSNMAKAQPVWACEDCNLPTENRDKPCDRCGNKVFTQKMRVKKREDGKVLKPEGWTPPDIKTIMQSDPPLPTRGEVKLSRAVILAQTRVGKIDDALTPLVRELLPRLQADLAVLRGALVIGEDEEWEGRIIAGLDLDEAGQEELELRLRAHENALQPRGARQETGMQRSLRIAAEHDVCVGVTEVGLQNPPLTSTVFLRGVPCRRCCNCHVEDGWCSHHEQKIKMPGGACDNFSPDREFLENMLRIRNPREEAMGRLEGRGTVSEDFDAPMKLVPEKDDGLRGADSVRAEEDERILKEMQSLSPQKPLDKLIQRALNVVKARTEMNQTGSDCRLFVELGYLNEAANEYEAWKKEQESDPEGWMQSLEEEETAAVIRAARTIQTELWGEANGAWGFEEWKRMFRKRVAKLDAVQRENPHAAVEVRKRLLQTAALSVALMAIIKRSGLHWEPAKDAPPSNLPQYAKKVEPE